MLQVGCCDSTETAIMVLAERWAARSIALEVTPQKHHREGDGPDEGHAACGFAIDQSNKSHRVVPLLRPARGNATPGQ